MRNQSRRSKRTKLFLLNLSSSTQRMPMPAIRAGAVVQDYLNYFGGQTLYPVTDELNTTSFFPQRILQRLEKDVHSSMMTRWHEKKPCAPLLLDSVRVIDHRAFLPDDGSPGEHRNYQQNFLSFHVALFGTTGVHPERDDFYSKLSKPNLSKEEFAELYNHLWYKNEEQRAIHRRRGGTSKRIHEEQRAIHRRGGGTSKRPRGRFMRLDWD